MLRLRLSNLILGFAGLSMARAAPAVGVRYVGIDSSHREERNAGSFAELARSAASGAVLANAANRTAEFLAAGDRVLTSAGVGG